MIKIGDYVSPIKQVDLIGKVIGITLESRALKVEFPTIALPQIFRQDELEKRSLLDMLAGL